MNDTIDLNCSLLCLIHFRPGGCTMGDVEPRNMADITGALPNCGDLLRHTVSTRMNTSVMLINSRQQ